MEADALTYLASICQWPYACSLQMQADIYPPFPHLETFFEITFKWVNPLTTST